MIALQLHALLATALLARATPIAPRQANATSSNSTASNSTSNSSYSAACSALWQSVPLQLANLTIHNATLVPAGSSFVPGVDTTANEAIAYPTNVTQVPEFCRFNAYITTSNMSSVQFEVFMPTTTWNGRFAMVGNGGDAGGVAYNNMVALMRRYGFALASTNAGHFGNSGNGTFALNNPQSQIDFGYRAVHLTTVYAKTVVKAFYNTTASKNYWIGCSSGGKQGLKEMFPEDYDGVLAGAAAAWWPHLNGYTYYSNAIVNAINSTGYLADAQYQAIWNTTIAQCDLNDGVKDSIVADPSTCQPDYSTISCSNGNANQSSCITDAQLATWNKLSSNWTKSDGTFLFPGFTITSSLTPYFSVNGKPFGPAPDYFAYQVRNYTSVTAYTANETELIEDVYEGDVTDPGQTNAYDSDISAFLSRGKLLTYHGTSDFLIPYGSSQFYHERVIATLGYDPRDSYRFFPIPGMGHCSRGVSAYNFGGPSQADASNGGSGRSLVLDAQHDMILALMRWTENGTAPDSIVSAHYIGEQPANGADYTRRLCPYPQMAKYNGGNQNNATSFTCQ